MEKLWKDNMVKVLTTEYPKLRTSALRLLFVLETKFRRSTWTHYFELIWKEMEKRLEILLSYLGGGGDFIEEDVTHAEEDFESLLVREKQTLESSVLCVEHAIDAFDYLENQRLTNGYLPPTLEKQQSDKFICSWIEMKELLNCMIKKEPYP